MIAEVAAAIARLKNLRDMIAAMKDSSEKSKLSGSIEDAQIKFIDLQRRLIESQESEATAKERARTAEHKCVELEEFAHEAERYSLKELSPGFLVYAMKDGAEETDPPHYLCTNCFSNHKKSIIQRSEISDAMTTFQQFMYECPACKTKVHPVPTFRRA